MSKRLGRGLADLIEAAPQNTANFVMLRADQIRPSRYQPRATIDEEQLSELKASIKKSGMIEPVVVRPLAHGTYELVAGERRFRASQALGLPEIPAVIKTLSDQEALELSLIENVQRENLNPIEEAGGYARLSNEFGYTQEDIAVAVGKDRTTITNLLRLLTLPEEIQHGVRGNSITMGHARALLSLEDRSRQLVFYQRVVKQQLSVRQTEALVGAALPAKRRRSQSPDPHQKTLEDELRRTLGTKVSLAPRKKGGRLIIEYFSTEDLTRLLQLLGVSA